MPRAGQRQCDHCNWSSFLVRSELTLARWVQDALGRVLDMQHLRLPLEAVGFLKWEMCEIGGVRPAALLSPIAGTRPAAGSTAVGTHFSLDLQR